MGRFWELQQVRAKCTQASTLGPMTIQSADQPIHKAAPALVFSLAVLYQCLRQSY